MSAGERLTELVDEVFRLADAFTRAGDAIVAGDGLTASRWLTLGRGMRRQSAAEAVGQLEASGLVVRRPDPADARAPLVALTERGREVLDGIRPRRRAWAEQTAAVAHARELEAAVLLARRLRERLDSPAP